MARESWIDVYGLGHDRAKFIEALKHFEALVRADEVLSIGKQALAAQPAVPDAFGTREGEHPQYVQGWNDCRAETLKMRKP
jgi:hypothetical protein